MCNNNNNNNTTVVFIDDDGIRINEVEWRAGTSAARDYRSISIASAGGVSNAVRLYYIGTAREPSERHRWYILNGR